MEAPAQRAETAVEPPARVEQTADAARVNASSSPAPSSELNVLATNGHANGHAANGHAATSNGNGKPAHRDPVAGHDERGVQDPGGRPQLRRMRLDHGPQRQLLQVPELRQHERLQLSIDDAPVRCASLTRWRRAQSYCSLLAMTT